MTTERNPVRATTSAGVTEEQTPEGEYAHIIKAIDRPEEWEQKWVEQNTYNDHLISENNKLRSSLRKAVGWRSIDVAPTDGTDILLSNADWHGDIVLGGWHFGAWREIPALEASALNPTVWMPLPKGPMATADQRDDTANGADFLKNEFPNDYDVRYSVEGEINITVKADSLEEARDKAEAQIAGDNLGLEIDVVNSVTVSRVWKTQPMFLVTRGGKIMQVSRLEEGDEPRQPNANGF